MIAALSFFKTNQTSTIINFNEFQNDWTNKTIKSFTVQEDKMTVSGTLKNGTTYQTVVPSLLHFYFY